MKNNNDFLNFISEFSNNVLLCQDLYSLDNLLVNSIKKIDLIKKIEVFIYEENIQKLRYFARPWLPISVEKQKFLYERFCLLDDENFSTENDYYKLTTKYCDENEKQIYLTEK